MLIWFLSVIETLENMTMSISRGRAAKNRKFVMKPTAKSAGLQAELFPISQAQRDANNRGPRRRWREQIIEQEQRKSRYRRRRGRRYETRTRDLFS